MQKDDAGRDRFQAPQVQVVECKVAAMTVSMLLTVGAAQSAYAVELPTPCVAGACGPAVPSFVTAGNATATQAGNSLLIDQLTQAATLNWRSFNISADGTVEFRQPNAESVALNRIWQADPSRIFGALRANGQIYLINQNGILFGNGAQVNVSGLVASSLNITPEALERGIAQAATSGAPAFSAFTDAAGNPVGGAVRVENGATLQAQGGQILLLAPAEVVNQGTIKTPDGQTLLAAGRNVYLVASSDSNLRGLLVEVDAGGTVTNGDAAAKVGEIIAERGNITLAGLAVNQNGRVSATTSVRANGSIRLQARDGAVVDTATSTPVLSATRGGDLQLGRGSVTQVLLDTASTERTVDANVQPRSRVELDGKSVLLLENSRIVAPSGTVDITARAASNRPPEEFTSTPDGSRLYMAAGATIDVRGAQTEMSVDRNIVRVELRGNQLRDSPEQRNGPLRGETVFVDARASGTRADGSTWQGTPVGDVSGDISVIQRDVSERNLTGGTVRLRSAGDLVLSESSTIDVSGGAINYLGGWIQTSQLLGENGQLYDISAADPNRAYTGIVTAPTRTHHRWGVTEVFSGFIGAQGGHYERGYVEGKDAGSVVFSAPRAVLDGNILAGVTLGEHQRQIPQAIPEGALYRPYNQVPLGGRLTIGNAGSVSDIPDYVARQIELQSGLVLPGLRGADGGLFDPLTDELPEETSSVRLRPELISTSKLSALSLFANEEVSVPAGVNVLLPGAGEFSATAGRVAIEGTIDVPSGTIALNARVTQSTEPRDPLVYVGSTGQLIARGGWVNDNPLLAGEGSSPAPLFIQGGNVRLSSREGDLELAAGSLIDVSGGAWRRSNGSISAGRGGNVSLSTTPAIANRFPTSLTLDGEIRAFALGKSGELAITANAVCVSASDCTQEQAGTLWLTPSLLESSGFSAYRLASNLGGITVEDDTTVRLVQRNFQLLDDPGFAPTGTDFSTLAQITTLRDLDRAPVNLSLTTTVPVVNFAYNQERFADAPILSVGAGAVIETDPLGKLTLQSNTRLSVEGSLIAPGGDISLTLDKGLEVSEFLASQAIWLGPNALLDASGTSQIVTDDLGRRSGDVYDGGRVSLTAQRGSIVMTPGSRIDVSGTQAELDLPVLVDRMRTYQPATVASDGGSISLTAAESIITSGELNAHRGQGAGARGGELTISLDASQRSDPGVVGPLFPQDPRTVVLRDTLAPIAIGDGSAIPGTLSGRAVLAADQVSKGGFESLNISSGNLFANSGELVAGGEIRFDGASSWSLGGRLTFNATSIVGTHGDVSLSAAYISFGQQDLKSQATPQNLASGTVQLDVKAGLIDFIGHTSLQGFESASFTSTGDIRARGVQLLDERALRGGLVSSGNLTFAAEQFYAATLADFRIESTDPAGRIEIQRAGGEAAPVLSAGGRLSFIADTIQQDGVLRAPLGEITFEARELVLGSGSVTSTSAAGQIIPFGTTQGGFDWVYELPDKQLLVFAEGKDMLPQQRVELNADQVELRSGAVVDVSGGGDLLAYEFVPGVGGSNDVLSPIEQPNQFAILPNMALDFAPYDTREFQGSTLRPGDSIYLSDAPGLKAGTYTLLPARYALLPGAILVTAADGYSDIAAGESFIQLNGSTVVAGARTFGPASDVSARLSGFAVRPGTDVNAEARYDTARASKFFAGEDAIQLLTSARMPNDAGILAITAGSSLTLDGSLNAQAGTGGRGAALDISAEALRVVADAGATPDDPSVVELDAARLSALGAESILLGGSRRPTDEGTAISVAANTLEIASGARLQAPEIILAAHDTVTVASGATLTASGQSTRGTGDLQLAGDGALLRLATGDPLDIVRTDPAGSTGTLDLQAGANLQTRGSMLLDASANIAFGANLDVAGSAVNLSSSRISFGDAPLETSGLIVDTAQLAALQARALTLTSSSSLDFYGDVQLATRDLTIRANALNGSADANVRIESDRVHFGNLASNDVAADPRSGTGQLAVQADQIFIEDGGVSISGFGSSSLIARNSLSLAGESALAIAGDLNIETPRISGDSGSSTRWTVGGAVSITAPSNAANSPTATIEALGARLDIGASSINLASTLSFPSGQVNLRATGTQATDGIVLGPNALIDVSGRSETFDGVPVSTPGGRVTLSAAAGSIQSAAGSRVDVSGGASGGEGGTLTLQAARGDVDFRGELMGRTHASATEGARLVLDAQHFGSLDDLTRSLNAGGFSGARDIRQRGAGNLVVGAAADSRIAAERVTLTADAGSIIVAGTIDASGQSGGTIELSGRDGINVSGNLLAAAQGANERGGSVLLDAGSGALQLGSSSKVDVSATGSARGGSISLRATRDSINTVLDADGANDRIALLGSTLGASSITLEGVQTYTDADGTIDFLEVAADASNPLFSDAQAFMASAGSIAERLGRAGHANFHVRAGLEIRSEGDLRLSSEWDLSQWKFGGEPGVLTLRAGRDLIFDASLSDGFTSASSFVLPTTPAESWSYRLVGGADLASANALGTLAMADAPADAGNVTLSTGAMVRTGTGDINIAAARSLTLSDATSVIYTAGNRGPGIILPRTGAGTLARLPYPTGGGDIGIRTGADIVGVQSGQMVTDWLWRVGSADGTSSGSATAWTVNFQQFRQNIGALGGGNVSIDAGGDLRDLSVNLPSIGRQVGGVTPETSEVEVIGGGELNVRAAGSVLGGSFYVGLGSGSIRADGQIGAATEGTLAPVFALGDASIRATALGNVEVEGVLNPTLLPQGFSQRATAFNGSTFSTFGENSGITFASAAGDVVLRNDVQAMTAAFAPSIAIGTKDEVALRVYPPSLRVEAARGDIEVQGSMTLFPAPKGNLELLADGNVRLMAPGSVEIFMSDADPKDLPSIDSPDLQFEIASDMLASGYSNHPNLFASIPMHADESQPDGVPDLTPVRLVARTGDIDFSGADSASALFAPKAVRLIAGRDVRDVSVVTQHVRPSDLSVIQAGRDVTFSIDRTPRGLIDRNPREIVVDGPGTLQVRAGGDVDLQNSSGISSRGNLRNAALSDTGADITVLAGLAGVEPRLAIFESRYLESRPDYDQLLLAFVNRSGARATSKSEALQALRAMPDSRRLELAQQILFAELRASGRDAANKGNADFTRGFEALETLLPGSNPDVDAGEKLPYDGDIRLYFSRIYTLDGGSISLLAPGGEINAGLATPPAAFNVNKEPSELGIVAQGVGNVSAYAFGDVQVNEARIFSADGGNILIWSTDGDIDAGRGAKTAISAPPPTITFDPNGRPKVVFPAALTGSGIQTLAVSAGRKPGDVDLFAPRGVVNAGDAGIVAGNLTIAATAVLGANNIQVSGTSVGVPVDTGGLAAGLTGASSVASGASSAATAAIGDDGRRQDSKAPNADTALSWLDVFVEGFGEDVCKSSDAECLKRQSEKPR